MAWALDEEYGAGVATLGLATRNATATSAELNVTPGQVVDVFFAVGAYSDGSHVPLVQFWNGSAWVDGTPISGSGALPTIDTSGEANTVHCASFLVPDGCSKVRAKVDVLNATTGAAWSVLIRNRQMILAVV